ECVATCFVEGALGDAQEDIAEDGLRYTRPQGGPDAAADARRTQDLVLVDHDVTEGHAAAIGLALTHVVPVVMHSDAFAGGRHDHDLQSRLALEGGGDE